MSESRKVVPLKEFGAVFMVEDGALFDTPMNADGSYDEDNWGEVTAPESQEFLDRINEVFGTNYRMEQFSGR